MLTYPKFDPVAFSIGPFEATWLGLYRIKRYQINWTGEQIADMIALSALGVIIGARIGHFLFYQWSDFYQNPLIFFSFKQVGLSFHGGFLGGLIMLFAYCHYTQRVFLQVLDFVSVILPMSLEFGRLGNFINNSSNRNHRTMEIVFLSRHFLSDGGKIYGL